MTTRTQHTPGPVAVSLPDADGRLAINAAETSREIARTSGWPNDKANAARLALSWNCHADLLAALEELTDYALLTALKNPEPRVQELIDRCQSIIAKAQA